MAASPGISVNLALEYRRADVLGGEVDLAIWLGSGGRSLHTERLGLDEEFAVSSPELAAGLPKTRALLAASLLHYEGARHTVLDWRRWYSLLFGAESESHGGGTVSSISTPDRCFQRSRRCLWHADAETALHSCARR